MAEPIQVEGPERSSVSAADRAPRRALEPGMAEPSDRIGDRCDHSVTILWAVTRQRLLNNTLTCGFVVGMRGFEPRISGPPDRRPGPNWATSRC